MSKYAEWLKRQPPEFIAEVNKQNEIPKRFIDYNKRAMSIDKLIEFDKLFCGGVDYEDRDDVK